MVNWNQYLESLCNAYKQWWQIYTITDVVGQKPVEAERSPFLFDFGLMVQAVERDREERGKREDKVERLNVLDGLRKYTSEHVLLVGRPGSGKSTALARLVLEEAEKARTPLNPPLARGEEDCSTDSFTSNAQESLAPPLTRGAGGVKIPVLVELRYYRTSILDLIQDFLQRHDPNLPIDAEMLKSWLRQGQLLLLVDGLNELPSEEARRDLQKFRQDYQKTTPMIFTTRDLGVGGDLDIAKKLEMQALSEAQMQQFVRAYLPEQGEQMLRQLGSRLREFGQTPLLLWMLCSLFKAMGKVPPNLGLVFRQFALSYDRKLKQDIPISGESRRWWHRLLEHLAWVMTCGKEKTQLQVAIPRQQAEAVLTEFLAGKVAHPEDCALRCLDDLLNHHLIQLGAGDQIEFRHQLIQEYYTAEYLLKVLPSLGDEELKREYLNYLKWTEPLALMLELVEDEAQAVRVVKSALEVDLRLGARLAGAVKPEFQEQTVGLVVGLDIPQLLKIQLLSLTKSERAIIGLIQALEDENSFNCISAVEAQGKIGAEIAISLLIRALEYRDIEVRWEVANTLGRIVSEDAIPFLMKVLEDKNNYFACIVPSVLGEIGSEIAIFYLSKILEHDDSCIRGNAAFVLGEIASETAIANLLKTLAHENCDIRETAADALETIAFSGKIVPEKLIPPLIEALKDKNSYTRSKVAYILGVIGSEAAVSSLSASLQDEDSLVRSEAANSLRIIQNAETNKIYSLIGHDWGDLFLNFSGEPIENNLTYFYRLNDPVYNLIRCLNVRDSSIREAAAKKLIHLSLEVLIPGLIQALEDEDSFIRSMAAKILVDIDSEAAIPGLIKILKNQGFSSRDKAVKALEKIGSEAAIFSLIEALDNEDCLIRYHAAETLGNIGSEAAIPSLIKVLEDEKTATDNYKVIQAIQNRCKFYRSTLIQPILARANCLMYILHLSDLHFGTLDQANLWSNQLAADLQNELSIPHLDALILSGDIANYSTEEEYQAAEQFLHNLRQDFPLNPEQIILVPGNHDLNWKLAKKAYKLIDRDDYDGELTDDNHIKVDESVIRVRDEAEYKQRFAHFSQFYEAIKQNPYPLDYDQQYTLDHLKERNLLILGLNSAWQLDHNYKSRASIHMGALTNALTQIRRNPDYKNSLKIAVWHHPLDSAYSDRITDQGFLEQLAVNGFRFFLHGHIHKAETSLYRYDMSSNGRKLDRICAGTFGAPVREWVPGYPLQYNLLKIADNQLTAYTRRREEPNGAWKPDARWLQGAGKTPLDYYEISLS